MSFDSAVIVKTKDAITKNRLERTAYIQYYLA